MFKRDKDDLEGREGQRATNDDGLTAGPDDASAPGPADSTPSEQAAPEAPPTDEAPTDEAPTDEAPTDEAPTDEAPAEPDAPEEPSALDAAAAEAAVPEPTPPPRPAGNRVRQLSDDPDISALLRRLDDVARSASDAGGSGMRRATEEVQQHNEALAATSSARQEAQRLLALATEERERAATAGASIIDEARQIAARLTGEAQSHAADAMAEIQRWATGQRASIASVVSDLTEAAQREADEIREEAHATALDDARTAAETYVARAAAIGVRDAERHRAEAAQALSRTADVVTAAHGTLQDFAATMATFVDSMTGHLTTLQEVVEQAEAGRDAATGAAPIAVDPSSWAVSGLDDDDLEIVPLPLQPSAQTESRTESQTEVEAQPEPVEDEVVEDAQPEAEAEAQPETDDVTDEQPVETDASDDDDETQPPTAPPTQLPPPPAGRPLGSLFRDPGYP